MRTRLQRWSALACACAALAGCGGGGSGAGADPATVIPAGAPVYLEIEVKPDGDRREDVLAAAGKLVGRDDPEVELPRLLNKLMSTGGREVDYDRDIEPWLGERAGVFLSDPSAEDSPSLLAVATTDMEKARAAVTRLATRGRPREASYRGVRYEVAQDAVGQGTEAVGVVGDLLVVGDEREFRQAVSAAQGESLAEAADYREAVAELSDERVATGWLDLKTLGDGGDGTPEYERLRRGLAIGKLPPVAVAAVTDGSRVALETSIAPGDSNAALRQLMRLLGGASVPLAREAPADAWTVLGVPDLGAVLRDLLPVFSGQGPTNEIYRAFATEHDLNIEQDLLPLLGDAALFVRGRDSAALDGAAIIEATDAAKARDVTPRLADAAAQAMGYAAAEPVAVAGAESAFRISAPQLPKDLVFAFGESRLVVAFGKDAAQAALAPSEKLGDTPGYDALGRAFDDGTAPASYVSMAELLEMLDAPALGLGPTYAKMRPYLERIAAAGAGGAEDGDRMRAITAIALK